MPYSGHVMRDMYPGRFVTDWRNPRNREDFQGTASQDKPPPAPANRSVHSCTMPSSGTAEPELTLEQPVGVFSRSADKWLKGRVVRLTDKTVRVEYEIGDKKCGKELDRQSEHLMITVMKYAPSLAEYDRP